MKKYTEAEFKKAHKHTFKNGNEINDSENCVCLCCLKVFKPEDINNWVTEGDGKKTAMCPYCFVDAIIGDKSGYALQGEFMEAMKLYWFGGF